MTSKEMKAVLEDMGFVVAHVRRRPRSIELRAYLAMAHDSHPEVDEIRYIGDGAFHLYEHAVKANGYGQYDKYVGAIAAPRTEMTDDRIVIKSSGFVQATSKD